MATIKEFKTLKNKWVQLNTQLLDGEIGSEIFTTGRTSLRNQIEKYFGDKIPQDIMRMSNIDTLLNYASKSLARTCGKCSWYRSASSTCSLGNTDDIIDKDNEACKLFI